MGRVIPKDCYAVGKREFGRKSKAARSAAVQRDVFSANGVPQQKAMAVFLLSAKARTA